MEMEVHQRLAQGLRELGVETVFGLMGDGNMRHLIDFADLGGTVVGAVTEGAAVSMADGHARIGRSFGVASVTHGPGVTNTLTSLTEAVRARTPLLVVTGDTAPRPDHLQRFDLRGLAQLAGADYCRVLDPVLLGQDLQRAAEQSLIASRPVLFDVPVALHTELAVGQPALRPPRLPDGGALAPDLLDEALGMLATARRPVILVGRGGVDAKHEVLSLARRLGAPVATTLLAKGLFAGECLDLGVVGTLGHDVAMETVLASDCLLVLGAGLNRYTTVDGAVLSGRQVIQVDRDPTRLRGRSEVAVAMVADVVHAVTEMSAQLAEAGIEPSSGHAGDLADRLASAEPAAPGIDGADTMDPRTVMRWLDRELPADRVVVTDTGRFAYAPWRLLGTARPTDFTHTCHFASIGLGLGTAIGAAEASGRPTVAVVGDGGGMMNLLELGTAVRRELPLLVVVCNDGAYGMEYRHLQTAGLDPTPALCEWPDMVDVARALGAGAASVGSVAELEQLRETLNAWNGPFLLEVRCDPAVDVSEN